MLDINQTIAMVKTKNTVQNFIDINNISYSFFSFSLSAFFPKLTNFYDRYCIIFQEKKKKKVVKKKIYIWNGSHILFIIYMQIQCIHFLFDMFYNTELTLKTITLFFAIWHAKIFISDKVKNKHFNVLFLGVKLSF